MTHPMGTCQDVPMTATHAFLLAIIVLVFLVALQVAQAVSAMSPVTDAL